jgi:hypothetical protein
MTASELLEQYIFLHNYGIENADFEPLMKIFNDHIIFAFEDPRIGTFEGIGSVRRIFRLQPPSVPIVIGGSVESRNKVTADYADENYPTVRLGSIAIDSDGARITKIFIGK